MTYEDFIQRKTQLQGEFGFDPVYMPDFLYDFQKSLVEWSCRKGRSAIFADCGLGKTPMQLAWSQNVIQKTNKPVLILTPLAVSIQTKREADKFGIDARRSQDGNIGEYKGVVITNYERLHYFNPDDFAGVVCDESSILKNFDGATKKAITDFMRLHKYRLLCTATAAPNDYVELGTSSEAIGEIGFMDMLSKFFKQDSSIKFSLTGNISNDNRLCVGGFGKYRFRGHAERDFWRWVVSWSRACRKPSDLGFTDNGFELPKLITNEHVIKASTTQPGWLFDIPASNLHEQREERRRTIKERCEKVASLVLKNNGCSVSWCHLNDEGKLLNEIIPESVEIRGSDTDDKKESVFIAFQDGKIKSLITKPTIAGFGLNWQHCAHETFFPSHSFEQWYQAIRRCWRFGQKKNVVVDVVASEGERGVLNNMNRKAKAAEKMFENLVSLMNNELKIKKQNTYTKKEEVPSWL